MNLSILLSNRVIRFVVGISLVVCFFSDRTDRFFELLAFFAVTELMELVACAKNFVASISPDSEYSTEAQESTTVQTSEAKE